MMQRLHRKLYVCACLIACIVTLHAQEVLDGVAAVVNGEVITFTQVRKLTDPKVNAAKKDLRGQELVDKVQQIRIAAILELVNRALIISEFRAKGYTVPEKLVDDQVDALLKEQFHGDRDAFERYLEASGMTVDEFRTMTRENIIVQTMRLETVKGVPREARNEREKQWLEDLRRKGRVKIY
jgi:hypothetical protein